MSIIKEGIHDYDKEYSQGAHWDVEPSSNMPVFISLLKGGEKILDAGCGTGRDSFYMSDHGFTVSGIDSSKVGIELANQRKGKRANVEFFVGKVEQMPFEDGEFDAAYSGYVLGGPTFPEQMRELSRVVKPGGPVYVAMFAETKYEKPSERDEIIPLDFILDQAGQHFEVKSHVEDTYSEEDDQGMHQHNRVKLVLINH